jgi:hypothetical protein
MIYNHQRHHPQRLLYLLLSYRRLNRHQQQRDIQLWMAR